MAELRITEDRGRWTWEVMDFSGEPVAVGAQDYRSYALAYESFLSAGLAIASLVDDRHRDAYHQHAEHEPTSWCRWLLGRFF